MLQLKTGSNTGSVTLTRDPTRPGQNRWPGDPWPGDPVPSLPWSERMKLRHCTPWFYLLANVANKEKWTFTPWLEDCYTTAQKYLSLSWLISFPALFAGRLSLLGSHLGRCKLIVPSTYLRLSRSNGRGSVDRWSVRPHTVLSLSGVSFARAASLYLCSYNQSDNCHQYTNISSTLNEPHSPAKKSHLFVNTSVSLTTRSTA